MLEGDIKVFSGLGNRTFVQSHIAHFYSLFSKEQLLDRSHIHSFQKSKCAHNRKIAFSKRAIVRSLFFSLFSREQKKSDRTIALSKRANEQKCANKVLHFQITPFLLFIKSHCTFQTVQMPNPALRLRTGLSIRIIAHCIIALLKKVIVRLLAQLLFPKEQLCKRSFLHFSKEQKRGIAQSVCQKERMSKNMQKKCEFLKCNFLLF